MTSLRLSVDHGLTQSALHFPRATLRMGLSARGPGDHGAKTKIMKLFTEGGLHEAAVLFGAKQLHCPAAPVHRAV